MLVNLNDHKVVVIDGGIKIVYPKRDGIMHMSSREETVGKVDGIPIVRMVYECGSDFLPPKKDGTYYIVPKIVRDVYSSDRNDLVSPGTNPGVDGAVVRKGKIKCVRRLRLPDKLVVVDK